MSSAGASAGRLGSSPSTARRARARDDADVQALGALRLAIDVEAQAWLAAVAQPVLEAQPVALGLGDFLALFVEEHLVIEAFGRTAAEDARDLPRLDDAVDQVL